MRVLLSKLRPWVAGAALVGAVLGLGYGLAIHMPVNPEWVYPALIVAFFFCDASFWRSGTR